MPLFGITIRRETELFTIVHAQNAEEAVELGRHETHAWATVVAEESQVKSIQEVPEWSDDVSEEGIPHDRE
jgi:hypothetical protein